jgi:hypothetical protein
MTFVANQIGSGSAGYSCAHNCPDGTAAEQQITQPLAGLPNGCTTLAPTRLVPRSELSTAAGAAGAQIPLHIVDML